MLSEDDLTWTTSRCNRLLRHILLPLAALRKEQDRLRKAAGEPRVISTAFATKATPRKTTNLSQLASARKPRGFDKACDPDWVPGVKPAGVKKTYGGRVAKNSISVQRLSSEYGNVGRPGEIAFTPLVARTEKFQNSPQLHSSPLRPLAKKKGPLIAKVDQIQIKKHMPYDTAKQVEGLLKAYANLLSATAVGEKKRWKGTRSLMGACLRQVPAFISLEEYFAELDKEEEDNDDERDIANEIYLELEERFELHAGQGWRPFRSIVRAHGTSLLCNAFADQILKVDTLHIVVSHCLDASAWDEAERLLWAYLPALKPISTPVNPQADLFDQKRSIYLWLAKYFVNHTGRSRFLYDVLEHMICQELLPLEWLATDCMQPLWHKLVRTFSDGDSKTLESASRFFETTILMGVGLRTDDSPKQPRPSARRQLQEALDTTFLSLFTVLSSISLVNFHQTGSSKDPRVQRVTTALDSVVIGLLKRGNVQTELDLLEPSPEDMITFVHRALWTMSASFLVHLGGCCLDGTMVSLNMSTFMGAMNWVALQYSSKNIGISSALATLPSFISSTARCFGKASQDDGFEQLQRFADALLSLTGFRLPHNLWNMKRLALESCLEFAQATNNGEHIAYARRIERSMREKGRVVLGTAPHENESPSGAGGFRWEEGIGEWVTCTPFIKQDIKRLSKRPIRALELLPTPAASEDEQEGSPATASIPGDALPDQSDEAPVWDSTLTFDTDVYPQLSPVETQTRKRRSASPMVVIPAKRTRITPPKSPTIPDMSTHLESRRVRGAFDLSAISTISQIEPHRRSRRERLSAKSQPEPQATRRSLEGSIDSSTLSESSSSRPRRSRRSRKEIKSLISNLRESRSRTSSNSSLRNITRKSYTEVLHPDDSESDQNEEEGYVIENMNIDKDGYERDELSKTPKRAGRRVNKRKTPWFVPVTGDESEDELSFQ